MAISFRCGCGKLLRTREELAGKKAKCPDCGEVVTIPSPSPSPLPAPAEEPDDFYGLLADPRTQQPPAPATAPEADGYGLASGPEEEPDAAPPRPFRPSVEAPSTFRPAPSPAAARSRSLPEPVVTESSPREFLYLLLVLALVPLAFSLLQKDERPILERLEKTMSQAPPEVEQRVKQLAGQEGAGLDELLTALPNGKLDDSAHLPRKTFVHWLYAVTAALAFWTFTLLLFPGEKKTPLHLLLVGLFTGTAGIFLLLGFQFLAHATRGVFLSRGNIVILIIFYIAKFIGFSYDSASDPNSNFALSFLGFTCGVGLCEELCKALPLLGYFRRDARMGWRGACLWGLASGIGFGVSEGVMYSANYYNGIGPASIYVVRFVSCVALHATWSASVGITLWRRQATIQGDLEWADYGLALLRIVAVPMVLHGAYDTLLKKDMEAFALAVGLASFVWFAWQVESARGSAAGQDARRLARA